MAPKFTILYARDVVEDLETLRAFDRRRIVDQIGRKLPEGALTVAEGQREPVQDPIPESIRARVDEVLEGLRPWSLHVGMWRVIYVVDGTTVHILALGYKGRRTFAGTFPEVD